MTPERMNRDSDISPVYESKSPEELEKRFGVSKVFGSLALAAAAMAGGMQNAQAGGGFIQEVNIPEIQQLQKGLAGHGITRFEIEQGFETTVTTNKGDVILTTSGNRPEEVRKALSGVTPEQFLREIVRQNNRSTSISDEVETPQGLFKVQISSYAQAVLKEYGVTYSKGVIKKDGTTIDLTGRDQVNPKSDCKITGISEFQGAVRADCRELKVENGRPKISSVAYKIDMTTLNVQEIKK